MPTRNGKIANLSNDIREQLNLRLLESEPGRELAAWLNALPEVQSVLASQFNGSPISEVNLTHWRQGGYLQWLTERECFDSARALAEGDCDLEKTGLSAERLLNILTLRFGQLLMSWNLPPNEGVSESAVFSEVARKARILQGISRSVLAIHRLQSRSAISKIGRARPSPNSPAISGAPTPKSASPSPRLPEGAKGQMLPPIDVPESIKEGAAALHYFREPRARVATHPEILSGPIFPSSIPSNLSQTPFEAGADLAEILRAG